MQTSIYSLADPRDGEIRYIGRTVRTLQARLDAHMKAVFKQCDHTHRRNWIEVLRKAGLRPHIELITTVDGDGIAEEQVWIDAFGKAGAKLVNSTPWGDGVTFGYRRPPEVCAKIGAASRGRVCSQETRAKISAANKGKKRSAEFCAWMREFKKNPSQQEIERLRAMSKGRRHTPESKRKLSEALKGRIISAEARQKLSAAHKWKIITQEQRDAISAKLKGRTITPEHRRNISLGQIGGKRSEETRQRMSEAHKRSWAKRKEQSGRS